ncbi:MAG: hypothetical protein ABUR63_10790, partial [Verrucomicrobiota bacterium]
MSGCGGSNHPGAIRPDGAQDVAAASAGRGGATLGGGGAAGQAVSSGGDAGAAGALPRTDAGATATAGAGGAGGAGGTDIPPPADHCPHAAVAPCFEPCGGDPYGSWILEESCFNSVTTRKGNCEMVAQGIPGNNDITLQILADGTYQVTGAEDWSFTARMSLGCRGLTSTDQFGAAAMNVDALLFSPTHTVTCAANACGACDCANPSEQAPITFPFSVDGTTPVGNVLELGIFRTPYCVQNDVLWIGGAGLDGTPKVSYKFRKKSCQGTPAVCEQRTPAQCMQDSYCILGSCVGTPRDPNTTCAINDAAICTSNPGCRWLPNACTGYPPTTCDFAACVGNTLGCAFGAPMAKCGGNSSCDLRTATDCTGPGCKLVQCAPSVSDPVDCGLLTTAADCAKAPGCVAHTRGPSICTGTTHCTAQTDQTVCQTLLCYAAPTCTGTSTVMCSTLSVDTCTTVP